jgi:hypothetical protein
MTKTLYMIAETDDAGRRMFRVDEHTTVTESEYEKHSLYRVAVFKSVALARLLAKVSLTHVRQDIVRISDGKVVATVAPRCRMCGRVTK